ncbi:DNA-invertase [Candidatus Burkholderia pumila]|uniref:DNA-invertase n=1 Tax=Candidatus Burkholderia pumila TaxID=1090375 RepID=A0ABR5HL46_9BURK|nr:DNA-invertase [Candidatus Burkholderia pumila]
MNQRIGYARVSTDDQHLDSQRDALMQAGCAAIYEEAASGKSAARPELEQCRKALRAGDTLVVWRLDRLGRSLPDLVQIVADLERQGVGFESLTEKIETGSAAGKLVFHVFAAPAEFERGLIRERTQAGLAAARARGRSGGRRPKLDEQQVREIKVLLCDPGIQVADIARRYGVSRTTLYKPRGRYLSKAMRTQDAHKKNLHGSGGGMKIHSTAQLSALTRLFSAAVFREMATKGRSGLFRRLLGQTDLIEHVGPYATVGDTFDSAFVRYFENRGAP